MEQRYVYTEILPVTLDLIFVLSLFLTTDSSRLGSPCSTLHICDLSKIIFLHLQNEANSMVFAGLFAECISNSRGEFSPGPGM